MGLLDATSDSQNLRHPSVGSSSTPPCVPSSDEQAEHSKGTVHPSRTHQKSYECVVCHESFTRPSDLRNHEKTHAVKKPFACEFPGCLKKFGSRWKLQRHQASHGIRRTGRGPPTAPYEIKFEPHFPAPPLLLDTTPMRAGILWDREAAATRTQTASSRNHHSHQIPLSSLGFPSPTTTGRKAATLVPHRTHPSSLEQERPSLSSPRSIFADVALKAKRPLIAKIRRVLEFVVGSGGASLPVVPAVRYQRQTNRPLHTGRPSARAMYFLAKIHPRHLASSVHFLYGVPAPLTPPSTHHGATLGSDARAGQSSTCTCHGIVCPRKARRVYAGGAGVGCGARGARWIADGAAWRSFL
ncbi:hypothetical protein B0H13DRAFT_2325908 [Mycena leptocephala]|nr:hypothetical protein B0H13DRAFT_2325908 [Mycena leptocephala]